MRSLIDCSSMLLLHMRKAGGTSCRRVLKKICQYHGIALRVEEGMPVDLETLPHDVFVVANFRHPVERVFSLFLSEGRFYGLDADEPPLTLEAWLAGTRPRQHEDAPPLWREPYDYYVRTLQGDYRRGGAVNSAASERNYNDALRRMRRLNTILITEWLDNPKYLRFLNAEFCMDETHHLEFPTLNRAARRLRPDPSVLPLTPEYRQQLLAANRRDTELYRHACARVADQAGLGADVSFESVHCEQGD